MASYSPKKFGSRSGPPLDNSLPLTATQWNFFVTSKPALFSVIGNELIMEYHRHYMHQLYVSMVQVLHILMIPAHLHRGCPLSTSELQQSPETVTTCVSGPQEEVIHNHSNEQPTKPYQIYKLIQNLGSRI